MKLQPVKRVPILITLSVVAVVGLVRWLHWGVFEKFECTTYDMRAREALLFPHSVATNLGFVSIDEASLRYVHTNRGLGRVGFGLYWPRQIFGRLVDELKEQGAKAVAMDVIFGDLRPDHPSVEMANGTNIDSDVFFAIQLRRASNAILAVTKDVAPPALFRTNAMALGDIGTDKDSDGVLRRALAFRIYTNWHSAFQQIAADPDYGVDLDQARVVAGQVVLPRSPDLGDIKIPLDQDGNFDLADIGGTALPAGQSRKAKPFTLQRRWHMGVVLAAQELNLDLDQAQVDLPHGRIELRGPAGIVRTIPVEPDGSFYIDWCIPPERTSVLTHQPIQALLDQYLRRLKGEGPFADVWRGKLVVVGSGAVEGNDLVDHGATPLFKETLLVSKHWNVANSIITDRFVHRAGFGVELALIALLGFLAAAATWELPPFRAFSLVVGVLIVYVGLATFLYVRYRYWLPIVFPLVGGLLANYLCLLVWRLVFEQAEQRRVRSIFSKVVSPKIVNELLTAETLPLDGARHEVTVLFADVRGFTEWTDQSQELAAEHVRQRGLTGAGAEAYYDVQARETLRTVNLYLGLIADVIKQQDGTLDKFIGDCVMAFWGAPTPNPNHASACVKAAIQAQRAMHDLNQMRAAENQRRQEANPGRVAAGQPELPLLPVLLLGTGINTGPVMAGLMGSGAAESESLNYTVFGREVNLASRLEGASGRGRIFVGERTFEHLQREDPALAATCVARDALTLKGFRAAIKVYEVPWQRAEGEPQKTSAATTRELPVAKA